LQIIITLLLIYAIYNHSTLISVYFHWFSLSVSWQRIYSMGTMEVSLNYTLPTSAHMKSHTKFVAQYNSFYVLLSWNFGTQLPQAEQSSSLLPATSQHGHSWHRAPWDPWPYICSMSRLLFLSFFRSSFDKKGWVGLFYNWCSLTTPYSTRGHIKEGNIYIV
jgi:hypothetical protein